MTHAFSRLVFLALVTWGHVAGAGASAAQSPLSPAGAVAGDAIVDFRLMEVDGTALRCEVDYSVQPHHGDTVYIGGWPYGSDGEALGGYRPAQLPSSGKGTVVLDLTLDGEASLVSSVEFFLFEPSKPPFVERRFPLTLTTADHETPAAPPSVEEARDHAVASTAGRPKPEDRWEWIGAQARTLVTGGEFLYMVNDTTGDIYQYGGAPGSWTRVGGPAHSFAAHLRGLYALSMDRGGIYEYLGTPGKWARIHGAARAVYAGGARFFFSEAAGGDIYEYYPGSTRNVHFDVEGPQRLGGPGSAFAVDAFKGTLFGLSPDKKGVFAYVGKAGSWRRVSGPAAGIFAGSAASSFRHVVYAIHPKDGGLLEIELQEEHERLTGTTVPEKVSQTRVGGPAAEFAVGVFHGTLWGLSPDRAGIYTSDGIRQESGMYGWRRVGGPAQHIFGGGKCREGRCWDQLYVIDSSRDVWRLRDPDEGR